jgi:excisionase family DNA binding protein
MTARAAAESALTMEQIRQLPATVDVETAARALGVSRSTAYEWIKAGQFPGRVITVRRRHRVITASLLTMLEHGAAGPA